MKLRLSLLSALLLNACFESGTINSAGVVITTNQNAHIRICPQDRPDSSVQSFDQKAGSFELKRPSGQGPWVLWANTDSLGAWTAGNLDQNLQLDFQPLHFLSLDTSALPGVQILQGYGGSLSPVNGKWTIPYQKGDLKQVWLDSAHNRLQIQQGTDSLQIQWKDQILPADPTSSVVPNTAPNSFTDSRDGQSYSLVPVGKDLWFGENMRYALAGSSICPDNQSQNCTLYGRLYSWTQAQQICPQGSHLPDSLEVQNLFQLCGNDTTRGTNLKGGNAWVRGTASNSCGFNAQPAGYGKEGYSASNFGIDTYFWTADTMANSSFSFVFYVHADVKNAFTSAYSRDYLMSVRCVRD